MTIIANSGGQIQGAFTIPSGVPVGTKLVEFSGAATQAYATFIGSNTIKTEDLRVVNTKINRRLLTWRGDPLAQTFLLTGRKQVAALDLWFTAKGTTNVLVQIRDVANGVPTLDVIGEALLTPAEITLNAWTRFRFTPTVLEADHDYAVVVACNDSVSAVGVAGVGEFDATAQAWVTSQPYQIGVLLSSSNNRSWTPHQTHDLTFRLLACDYDVTGNVRFEGATSLVVPLSPVTVSNADHLMVLASIDRPSPDCDVTFNLTVDGAVYSVMESQPFTLAAKFSGVVTWEAVLTGTYFDSPTLYQDVQLIAGNRLASSDYITRAMLANSGTKITIYYDVLLPGAATVTAYYENGTGTWAALTLIGGTALGDGWYEIKREITGFSQLETRIKLTLNGSANSLPIVKNLRVAIT